MIVKLFGNEKCGSCRRWKPVFESLMTEYNINHEYVDIDKNPGEKLRYNIHGIPNTMFFDDNGNVLGNILGNMNEDIARKQIEYYNGLGKTQG